MKVYIGRIVTREGDKFLRRHQYFTFFVDYCHVWPPAPIPRWQKSRSQSANPGVVLTSSKFHLNSCVANWDHETASQHFAQVWLGPRLTLRPELSPGLGATYEVRSIQKSFECS